MKFNSLVQYILLIFLSVFLHGCNDVGTATFPNVGSTSVELAPVLGYTGATGVVGSVGSAMNVAPTVFVNEGASMLTCVSSPALPVGLSLNPLTCTITGTPSTSISSSVFVITATNTAGSTTANLTLRINANTPVISYAGANGTTIFADEALSVSPTSLSPRGAALTGCSVSPVLPSWADINNSTCVISGTPTGTLSSTTYTVTATNSVGSTTANVTLEVESLPPTISYLTSIGTNGQTRVGASITPSTLQTNGSPITSCSVSPSLSAGLSLHASTCVISGVPTVTSMPTIYTVTATNSAGSSAATVTLSVDANVPMLSYSGASGTSGLVGVAMSVIPTTLNDSGAAITSCTVSPSLPTGLTIHSSTCEISGTPTSTLSVSSFSVTATNSVGSMSASVNLSVVASPSAPTISYSGAAGTSGNYGIAMSVSPVTLVENGAAITSCTISPALPAWASINNSTCVISGTPNGTLANTTYTVTATNSIGSTNATLSLSVGASAPVLGYSGATGTNGSFGVALSVTPTNLALNGGALTNCTISPALSAGLSIDPATCVISGTPAATLTSTSYTVTATNSAGSTTALVSLSVASRSPTLSYSGATGTTGNFGSAMSVAPTTLSANGSALINCTVSPALPSWASVDASTCVIRGVPTSVLSSTTYTVSATNSIGTVQASVDLEVNAVAPTIGYLTSTGTNAVMRVATTITPSTLQANGSAITSCSISPSLSAGLSIDPNTCVISGTPSATSMATIYTVTATNTAGSSSSSVTISVDANSPLLSYSGATGVSGQVGVAMSVSPTTLDNGGASVSSCTISPALSAGLSIDSTTCVISGTPNATLATSSFTVTATNSVGSHSSTLSLSVGASAPILSYAGASGLSGEVTVAMSVSPTTLNANGASVSNCTISPSLPAGLSIHSSTCVISGTPTVTLSSTSFTVTVTNSIGSSTSTVTLSVAASAPILSYSGATGTSGSFGSDMSVTPTTLANNGSAITSCNVSPSLPAWASLDNSTCAITGTPNATLSSTSYTITATNGAGSTTATLSLSVAATAPTLSYLTSTGTNALMRVSTTITPSTLSTNGASVSSCTISPSLSAGLSIDSSTCVISGTPTVVSMATVYTVTVTNFVGSSTANVTVSVDANSPLLSYSGASGTNGQVASAMSVSPTTLNNSGAAVTGCSASPSLPAWASLNSSTCVISGTPDAVLASTTYTITATNSVGSTTGTVTLSVVASAPIISYSGVTGNNGEFGALMSVTPTTLSNNGAALTNCTSSPALPSWASLNASTCVISGTPDALLSASTYTITATNSAGSSTATLSLSVAASAPSISYSGVSTSTTVGVLATITPSTLGANGSSVTGCTVSPSLPSWASIHNTTCVISGIPDAVLSATSYTVTVTNAAGSRTTSITISASLGASPLIALASEVSNPGTTVNPVFTVTLTGGGNFSHGDVITIYEGGNNTCNGTSRGSSSVSGSSTNSVDVTSSTSLTSAGQFNYFAKVANVYGASVCSSVSASYSLRPTPPTLLTRLSPSRTPGTDTTAVIQVSGGGVVNGASVTLYSDSGCSSAVSGPSTASGSSVNVTTNTLSAGAYTFFAKVTQGSLVSDCSSIADAANYLIDLTPPAAPAIALNWPASSPGTNNSPSFSVSLEASVAIEYTDTVYLYAQTACAGTSVGSTTSVSATSTTVDASPQASDTTKTYSVKITDESGNSTCSSTHSTAGSRSADYLYDATVPTWSNTLSNAASSVSLTSAPDITFVANASDGSGSGIAKYQYSIGTTSGGTQTKSWTDVAGGSSPSSPLQASGLNLSTGTTYYLNMRAVDAVGRTSTAYTTSWQVPFSTELRVTTQPSTTTKANAAMASNVVIKAYNTSGVVDTSFTGQVTIALGSNLNSATLGATSLSVNAISGVATFSNITVNKVGTYTLVASATGYASATTNSFSIGGDRLRFITQPSSAAAGVTMPTVTVRATDGFGIVDTSFTSAITVAIDTNPASGTLSGTLAVSASSGSSSFSNLSINNAGNGYVLRATATGMTTATSSSFNVITCTLSVSSGTTTIAHGSSYSMLCVSGTGTVIIPAGITTTIDNLFISTSTATVTLNQNMTFQNVTVSSGVLNASGFDNLYSGSSWTNTPGAGNGKLIFGVTGALVVGATGQINMDGKGYAGGVSTKTQGGSPSGPGSSSSAANGGGGGSGSSYPAGGSYGIAGVEVINNSYGTRGSVYGASDFTTELYLGSGGGYSVTGANSGGAGGGAISITAGSVSLASGASISAKSPGTSWGGSGSGGTIVINTTSFTNAGATITVAPGTAANSGMTGGYGRIYVTPSALLDTNNNMTLSGLIGYQHNLAATDAVNTYTAAGGSIIYLTKTSGASISTLTISGSSTVFLNNSFSFNAVNVTSGTLTSQAFDNLYSGSSWTNTPGAGNGKLIFSVSGALTVGATGQINMDGKGYAGGLSTKTQGGSPSGPGGSSASPNGGGGGSGTSYPAGGSYGTLALEAISSGYGTRGSVYGASDFTTELYLGSGGGYSVTGTNNGGAGGGAISITAGSVSLASGASLSAKSAATTWGGSGSGGTIVINTTSFTNAGATITVAPGTAVNSGMVGGYGRIYIPPAAIMDASSNITLTGFVGYQHNLAATDAVNTYTAAGGSIIYLTKTSGASISTLTISGSSTVFLNNSFSFDTVNVTSGTLTSQGFDNLYSGSSWTNTPGAGNGKLIFSVSGALTVGATGQINMDGKGYAGGLSTKTQGGSPSGPGGSSASPNGGGGGSGTSYPAGGSYGTLALETISNGYGTRGSVYGASDYATALYLGSGGGYSVTGSNNGGTGGGAISITAGSVSLASGASLSAKSAATTWGGSGSGGTIVINTTSFTNSGASITVAPGAAANSGMVGGYGRIYIPPAAIMDASSNITLTGFVGYQHNLAATDAINTFTAAGGSIIYLTKTSGASISTLTISGSSTVFLNNSFSFDTVNVTSGTLTSQAFDNLYSGSSWTNTPGAGNGKLIFSVSGALTVGATGQINMDGKGYAGGTYLRTQGGSPSGAGTVSSSANGGGGGGGTYGGGGSYGSWGKYTTSTAYGTRGNTYGAVDFITQSYLGAGGGYSTTGSNPGSAGGGAISITAGSVSLASGAILSAKSLGTTWGATGSGGSIVINTTSFANSGATMTVASGVSVNSAMNGGFGRLGLIYATCTGSYCPHSGAGTGIQYVPSFSYLSQCLLSSGKYTCISDTTSAAPPTSITLQNPSSTPSSVRTPTFQFSGGYSWQQGRIVKVYSNSTCTSSVASKNIGSGSTLDITIPSLTSDGSYLFYATIINEYGDESPCSSVAAPYVLSTTPALVPTITNNTATPNTLARPSFNARVQGGGNFSVDDIITLHEGNDCSGAAVSIESIPGAVSSDIKTRSSDMSEGLKTFRIKLTNSAGNTSCSIGVGYNYDNTAPVWSSGPIIASVDNPYNSTTSTPSIAWTNDATDSNTGVAYYEYAIGTGTSGASLNDVKNWTSVSAASFTATGLSLTDRQRYYVNMRAVDVVGWKSSILSDFWVVDTNGAVSITLSSVYPTNGANWNDYVKNDGADIISGTDTACVGTETNRTDCVHAGEIKKATIAAESSCSGLVARDYLGAFSWSCKVVGGQAVVYSTGLKSTKSSHDLIDFSASDWKTNYLIVTGGSANTTYQSSAAKWWSNTFVALPNNSANSGTSQTLSGSSGTIYLLSSSRATAGGYSFGADKLAIIADAGVTLTWNTAASATTANCGSRTIICVYNRKFVWVDVATAAGSGTYPAQYGYYIFTSSFSRFENASVTGTLLNGFYTSAATKSVFGNISANNSAGGNGISLNSSVDNLIGNVTANSNYSTGLYFLGSTDNVFGNVTANSNLNTGNANGGGVVLQGASHRNTFSSITANGNKYYNYYHYSTASNNIRITGALNVSNSVSGKGVSFNGANHSVGDVIANNNGDDGFYLSSVTSSTFGNVTANSNYSSGLYLMLSTDNTFGNITANSNLTTANANGSGVLLQQACHRNTFGTITANGNKYHNFYMYSTASNNLTINGALNVSNSISSDGAFFNGSGHTVGDIVANNNGGDGVTLSSTTSSTFGNITANSNYSSGLYLLLSTDNTFGNVTANSNLNTSNANAAGVLFQQACHRNTFASMNTSNNGYSGVRLYSTVSNNITVTGATYSERNGTYGAVILGAGHRFGNYFSNNNTNAGINIAGCTDCRFGRVVTNGNRGAAEGGVMISAASVDVRFNSLTSMNNTNGGLLISAGITSGLIIRDYFLASYNAYGFINNSNLNNSIFQNVTVASNSNYGFNLGVGGNNIVRNIVAANNGTYGFGMSSTGTNNTIANLIATNNATYGISQTNQTTAAYLGVLMVGNNTTSNCYVTGGTTPGLVTTTCSSAGTDGSTAYGTGAFSSALLRVSKSLTSSFAGYINAPGDNTNASDGAAGIGSGQALWDTSIDMINFDNIFRFYGNAGGAISGLSQSQTGPGSYGSSLKIWDWSVQPSDSTILNKSGNGTNINNGVTLSSSGTISSGENSFTAYATCPVQVLGDRSVESRPYTYDATNYPLSSSGFQSAGSGSACSSGTTCVRRFLVNASEITGDGIGNDDGLCESSESCVYNPNFGAYQGHFDANESNPTINHSSHECTWVDNSGAITNVRMYGYPKNGR